MDEELSQTLREIRRVIDTLPSWCPRVAWALHPRDWALVREQMRGHERMTTPEIMVYGDRLYVLGVRVFEDADAPRLCEIGRPRAIPMVARG